MSNIFLGEPTTSIEKVILNPKITKPLTFIAEANNAKLSFNKNNNPNEISIEYSINDGEWQDYEFNTQLTVNINEKICFRAKDENATVSQSTSKHYRFVTTSRFAVSGNIQTLLKADGSRLDAPAYCYYRMFDGCRYISSAPDLFANQISTFCYGKMFRQCQELKNAPGLPAKQLAENCYEEMFDQCAKLESAPILHSTELADYCYYSMFSDCTSLKIAPNLPAMQLKEYCYTAMFNGCTSLEAAPELPATKIAHYCYQQMFEYCESMKVGPSNLPAMQLTWHCYENMFADCYSLEKTPHLPNADYRSIGNCYYNMFYNCHMLSSIEVDFDYWEYNSTSNWLKNAWRDVEGDKIFICYDELTHGESDFNDERISLGWVVQIKEHPKAIEEFVYTDEELQTPLTFTNKRSGVSNSIKLIKNRNPDPIHLLYSTDGESWYPYEIGTEVIMPNFNNKVMFKARPDGNARISKGHSDYYKFVIGSKYYVSATGNVQTLLDASGQRLDVPEFCFNRLFDDCDYLNEAPILPAKKLSKYCYMLMFARTHIQVAPKLPAKKMAERCYASMFNKCSWLKEPPILRSTHLATGCYAEMFYRCSSLKRSPELPATQLAPECYQYMFGECDALINAPKLPATQLVDNCYESMFYLCGMLKKIEVNFTDWKPNGVVDPTLDWVDGAGASSQQPYPISQCLFVCPAELKHDESCIGTSMIPSGWTVVEK